jgi:ATP-dependent helicase/nuclease subunit B
VEYLFRRNWRELELVVQELWEELKESSFRPEGFELNFGEDGEMPTIAVENSAMRAVLRGFVDRVDIWKKDGMHYFRVVDYKTGRKDFDYCDVFNGVGLQMLLYLFALERQGADVVGGHPIAAGVQYFPARVPLVSADGRISDEEARKLRGKEWKRKGLLLGEEDVLEAMEPGGEMRRLSCTRKKDGSISGDLADREQLRTLERYVFHILGKMVEEIASGDVRPNPYTRGSSHDACTYCPYGAVCHKNQVPGRRNYKTMTAQRFWEEIEREVNPNG